jgi:hypothetical protein
MLECALLFAFHVHDKSANFKGIEAFRDSRSPANIERSQPSLNCPKKVPRLTNFFAGIKRRIFWIGEDAVA